MLQYGAKYPEVNMTVTIPFKEGDDYAASYMSWDQATAYCRKLSVKEGKTYRLPTEAEWEYACRAGTTTIYSFGDDKSRLGDYAWSFSNAAGRYPQGVGLKKPNAWGLHDLHGNVWEWCSDRYDKDYYANSAQSDPIGPTSGSFRVLRGGSLEDDQQSVRSAHRNAGIQKKRDFAGYEKIGYHDIYGGFRVVRDLN